MKQICSLSEQSSEDTGGYCVMVSEPVVHVSISQNEVIS